MKNRILSEFLKIQKDGKIDFLQAVEILNKESQDDDYIRLKELSKRLSIPESTLKTAYQAGKIHFYKMDLRFFIFKILFSFV